MAAGRVPVFGSVGAGLHFAFIRLFSVLRSGLLPVLLAMPALAATEWYTFPAPGAADPNAETYAGIANLVYIIGSLMLAAGLTKAYFREPLGPLYFWFGAAELRMIAATLLILLIFILVAAIPFAVAIFGLGGFSMPFPAFVFNDTQFALEKGGQAIEMAWPALIGLSAVLFIVAWFIFLRLALIVPIIVKERRIGLGRSWVLMRGNIWRMLGLLIILSFVMTALLVAGFTIAAFSPLGAYVGGLIEAEADGTLDLSMILTEMGLVLLAVSAFVYLLLYGVFTGAMCRAYEAVVESDDVPASAPAEASE